MHDTNYSLRASLDLVNEEPELEVQAEETNPELEQDKPGASHSSLIFIFVLISLY
jgi:hypothetical protein